MNSPTLDRFLTILVFAGLAGFAVALSFATALSDVFK